jgi:hypothetical protein
MLPVYFELKSLHIEVIMCNMIAVIVRLETARLESAESSKLGCMIQCTKDTLMANGLLAVVYFRKCLGTGLRVVCLRISVWG